MLGLRGFVEKVESKLLGPRVRRQLVASVSPDARILEIGGGFRPTFPKARYPNARSLDHASREQLIDKFLHSDAVAGQSVDHLLSAIEKVDYVWSSGPMSQLFTRGEQFDIVFSSHNVEHQTDLVEHLKSIERVLAPEGRAVFFVPDYRRTFDALRFPTTTGDALVAHLEGRSRHVGKAAFDSVAYSIDTNPGRTVFRNDFDRGGLSHALEMANADLTVAATSTDAAYQDRHAWVFCPASFELLLVELNLLGYVGLLVKEVRATVGNEFMCAMAHGSKVRGDSEHKQSLKARRHALLRSRLPFAW